jgi:dTDP-4-amino-4,6-dideoxygalactose transaminase
MKIELVDLKAQYNSIKPEIDAAIAQVIENSAFIMGKIVSNFEHEFARFCSRRYCITVSNGTSAIELLLKACGIGEGDEVITSPHTFIATAEAIVNVGAQVRFCDIDERTYTMDPQQIEKKITSRTKAILPVHLYGQPAEMDAILEIADRHRLRVIEDCAQAHGAEYRGQKVPVSGMGCFSFYPGKNLGAFGDAGCIVTDGEEIYLKCCALRDHGRFPGEKYTHSSIGSNYRMDALQAGILSVKLKYLSEWNEKRRKNAAHYRQLLHCQIPQEIGYLKHVYHLLVLRSSQRDKILQQMKAKGISGGVHYPVPLHLQPALSFLNGKRGDFPMAEMVAEEVFSLPMYPELTEEQIEFVCSVVNSF